MTEEEHQAIWPYAQGLITGAARNAPKGAGDDYFHKEAEYIIQRTGYGREFINEIANSIKKRVNRP